MEQPPRHTPTVLLAHVEEIIAYFSAHGGDMATLAEMSDTTDLLRICRHLARELRADLES